MDLTNTVKPDTVDLAERTTRSPVVPQVHVRCQRESLMFARNVTLHLKPNTPPADFTRTLETDVLHILRKRNGVKDEITFFAADRAVTVAITLRDRKESLHAYSSDSSPK